MLSWNVYFNTVSTLFHRINPCIQEENSCCHPIFRRSRGDWSRANLAHCISHPLLAAELLLAWARCDLWYCLCFQLIMTEEHTWILIPAAQWGRCKWTHRQKRALVGRQCIYKTQGRICISPSSNKEVAQETSWRHRSTLRQVTQRCKSDFQHKASISKKQSTSDICRQWGEMFILGKH